MNVETVRIERMATGGEAVGRLADGRVVFVSGSVPGELVEVEITAAKKRWARGDVLAVVESGPDRVPIACGHALSGQCGGCDWQHVSPESARTFKTQLVAEQLERLGKIANPQVSHHGDAGGKRVTARCAVTAGRAGYRARKSNECFAASACQALHPDLEQLVVSARYPGVDEVTLRLGSNARMAVLHRGESTAQAPSAITVPDDVVVVEADDPGDTCLTMRVAERDWRLSPLAFFQTSDRGTETLVSVVSDSLEGIDGAVVDLYCGGGLLGGASAGERMVVGVESDPVAVRDARFNLGDQVEIVASKVEHWTPNVTARAVIADPARAGLSGQGVRTVNALEPTRLVLVSCDPASLGRDAKLLTESGWTHGETTVVDMFPDTSQIEAVTVFNR